MTVSLRELNDQTVWAVCRLETAKEQRRFVAPNIDSIVEAYFDATATFRGIYADETPVGFLMWRPTREGDHPSCDKGSVLLWRFMIDARYQRQGYGRAAFAVFTDFLLQKGVKQVWLSHGPGDGGPREFYLLFGFRDTGAVSHGEHIMVLNLPPNAG